MTITGHDLHRIAKCVWTLRAPASPAAGEWNSAINAAVAAVLRCSPPNPLPRDDDSREPDELHRTARLRVGGRVGRTVYALIGPEPTDDDPLVGVMDSPALAARVVDAANAELPSCVCGGRK